MFPNEKIVDLIKALKAQDNTKSDRLIEDLIKISEKRGTYKVSKKLREAYSLPYSNKTTGESSPSRIPGDPNENNLYEIRRPAVRKKDIILSQSNLELVDEILTSYRNREILAAHNIPVESRVLLYGPPGTGKTLLAYVLAGELGVPVMHVNIDMLVSSYLGETGKNISKIFEEAVANNCLVLLDEFDAIAKNRDDELEVGELKRVVTVLLQNLDALNSDVLIVAATNHDHLLDKAIRRRFAYDINLEYLDNQARDKLLRLFLRETKQRLDYAMLANITEGLSGAQIKLLVNRALRKWIFSNKKLKLMSLCTDEIIRFAYSNIRLNTKAPEDAKKLADVVELLREVDPRRYTFHHIETLTSISDATIHDIFNRQGATK